MSEPQATTVIDEEDDEPDTCIFCGELAEDWAPGPMDDWIGMCAKHAAARVYEKCRVCDRPMMFVIHEPDGSICAADFKGASR